ncbi:CubicO group peptidase (beta-lactamase class C family) [Paenibacillus forsythiae]|uniref:CubicO group peptidase (Beta-lactamase class C family) n=1 Tax=Paenibacillus forsythiae TaxID=365616 RepID=A0ABU3H6J2_9BACL|nr:serine hydrolase domain-containing protein [Paenibacillus forsythiae]MDT3426336.1 CubicO group peptidase (beta-lactamase class C family) [Paenibacillus forsythiae]
MKSRFQQLADYVYDVQLRIGATAAALYVLQNGQKVHESYSGKHDEDERSRIVDAHTQFNVGSVRKTYLALAISLLIEQGRIESIDDSVSRYLDGLPSFTHDVTLRHLVTHTHGLMEREGQLIQEFPAGKGWAYRNAGIALLFQIISRLTGMTLSEFMTEAVFKPYGLRETGWCTAPHEHLIYNYYSHPDNWVGPNDSTAGDQSNLFVSARDLAKWGQLHLRRGTAEGGEQVLPFSIFERVTALHTHDSVPSLMPRNGYIWWLQHDTPVNQIGERVPAGSYQALGITGCAVLVIPSYDAVAVRMYNQLFNPEDYDYLKDIRTFGNLVSDAMME